MSACSYIGGSGWLLSLVSGTRSTSGNKYYRLVIEENRRGVGIYLDISKSICLVQLVCRDMIELNNITTVWER